jgi:hypothetical protein
MVRKLIFIFSLLLTSTIVFSQEEKYECEFNDEPVEKVIQYLEEKYGLLFSYRKDDLIEIYISEKSTEKDLTLFLEKIFTDSGLEVEIVGKKYVLLKKKPAIGKASDDKNNLITFCGTILDADEKKPLIGANIFIQNTSYGNFSDTEGRFEFSAPIDERDTIIISYIGYSTLSVSAKKFTNGGCPQFSMKPDYGFMSDAPVIITEYLTDGIELSDNGGTNILNPNKIGALPGQVEPDIFSTINFLPGISSSTGEHSSFNVRGGASDQNLIMWEGIPVYQPAHYFGMISAFNPYIIDEIKVYRGGFGPEYGGRVSGIIDMSSKKPFDNKAKFGAGLNFLNGYAYGKTPFLENKGYFIFSARHSINEIWRSPTFENISRRNQQGNIFENIDIYDLPPHISISDNLNFFDTQLKGNINLSEKDELTAAYFYTNNEFDDLILDNKIGSSKTDILKVKTEGASFSWKHNWKNNFFTKASLVTSHYDHQYDLLVDFSNGNFREYNVKKENSVHEMQINILNEYTTHKNHTISLGYQNLNFNVDYLIENNRGGRVKLDEMDEFSSDINVLHAGIKTNPLNHYGVDAGIRWNHYSINSKDYFEPRLRVWYRFPFDLTLSANAGRYNQFISQLIELKGNQEGIETPIWVMTGEGGRNEPVVLSGTQFQVGAIFQKNKWLLDVQAYTKKIEGISSLSTGFDPNPRQELGNINAKGIDILLKKRWRKYKSWLSYSLSETIYQFNQFFDSEFFAPYHQRHSLSWVHLYEYKNFEFSFGLELTSGNPYSVMSDFFVVKDDAQRDVYIYKYDGFNDNFLPFQHRADASITYRINYHKNQKLKGVVGLSFFNIYHHTNYYARDYFVQNFPNMPDEIRFVNKAHLGFTPNAVFRLEW